MTTKLRRVIRVVLAAIVGVIAGALLVAAVSMSVAGVDWTIDSLRDVVLPERESLSERLARSGLARWWRCRGVSRPLLSTPGAEWTLHYSWTGGYGPGDVFLDLHSDGRAQLSFRSHGGEPSLTEAVVPAEAVARLAETIDSSGLLCLEPLPREGYQVVDLGRFAFRVDSAREVAEVFVDGCHYVADDAAFAEALDATYELEAVLGERVSWGPLGVATVSRPCGD